MPIITPHYYSAKYSERDFVVQQLISRPHITGQFKTGRFIYIKSEGAGNQDSGREGSCYQYAAPTGLNSRILADDAATHMTPLTGLKIILTRLKLLPIDRP